MDTWAKDWLEEQRKARKKCLEIKVGETATMFIAPRVVMTKKSKKVAKCQFTLVNLTKNMIYTQR